MEFNDILILSTNLWESNTHSWFKPQQEDQLF